MAIKKYRNFNFSLTNGQVSAILYRYMHPVSANIYRLIPGGIKNCGTDLTSDPARI